MAKDWNLPWTGGCLCGELRFEISAPPLVSMACHCRGCQKLTASAFSLTLVIPRQGFAMTRGSTVIGGLHGENRYGFCDRCKTWLLTEPKSAPELVFLRSTMLDDADWVVPFIESMTCEKLPWVELPVEYSFERFPDPSEYAEPIAAFAERGARPA